MSDENKIRSGGGNNLITGLYTGKVEKSVQGGGLYPRFYERPYNPDDLYKLDNAYKIYEDMGNDDQVHVCEQLKKDLMLASGWDLVPSEQDDLHKQIVDEVTFSLLNDPIGPDDDSFEDMMEEILSAHKFGFSITEKVFKINGQNQLALSYLKTRHPSSFILHTDDGGNVSRYEQVGSRGSITLDPESIIHYVSNPAFQNPYGTSDLRKAYNAWFTKRQVVKFYGVYLEKAAGATAIGRYDKNAPQSAIDAIFNALKTLQSKTALTIPKEVEIEFLESKHNGEAYYRAINIFNMFIGRALMIPDLLGFQGSETGGGSYDLGENQILVFFKHLQRRRAKLERAINNHIIRPIVTYNYGEVLNYPRFKFRPIEDKHLVELAKLWVEMSKGKTYEPSEQEINHFRSLVNFPEGEVDRDVEITKDKKPSIQEEVEIVKTDEPVLDESLTEEDKKKAQESALVSEVALNGAQVTAMLEVINGVALGTLPRKSGVAILIGAFGISEETAERMMGEVGKSFVPAKIEQPEPFFTKGETDGKETKEKISKEEVKQFAKKSPLGPYAKKVNFKMIETSLDSHQNSILVDSRPVVKKIYDALYEDLKKKRIIETQDLSRFEGIELKHLNELVKVLKTNFKSVYADSQSIAKGEVEKGVYAKKDLPLADDTFLSVLNDETYQFITDDYAYQVKKKTRLALTEAIKDGHPLSYVTGVLDDEGKALSEVQLERFARTKSTEVMNRARVAYFNESGIVSAYQYSAILDDVTSDICAGLDGKIFPAGSEPIPPLHFNCRSTIVPITKYEKFEVDDEVDGQPIDKFIEENKGEGFAKYDVIDQVTVQMGQDNILYPIEFRSTKAFTEAQSGAEIQQAPGQGLSIFIKEVLISFGIGGGVKFVENTILPTTIIETLQGDKVAIVVPFKQPVRLTQGVNLGVVTSGIGLHSVTVIGCIAPTEHKFMEY